MNLKQGKISFQANNRSDIFLVLEVWENGVELSDEARIGVTDPQFENNRAWVNGKVPQMNPVNVDGDTTIVHAWFTAETLEQPFYMTVYLECEMEETLEEVELELTEEEAEEKQEEEKKVQENLERQKESDAREHSESETEEHFY